MPTQRIYFSLVLCTFLLFSCKNKKQFNTAGTNTISEVMDTVAIAADETINLTGYHTGYERSNTEQFTVLSHKISVLTGKKGLKVTVDPSALEKENGKAVDGKIVVQMIELTTTDDLFKSNAATVSNGSLLASGGSYFISMECNGEKLRIKNGRSIQFQFPKIKEEEMELFYGKRDEAGGMNWLKAGKGLQEEAAQETEDIMFTDNNAFTPLDNLPSFAYNERKEIKVYSSLKEEVYYYQKKMTIKELVDTINRFRTRIMIDTVYPWPKVLAKLGKYQRIDSNYLYQVYGPPKQFILKTCRSREEEIAQAEREKERSRAVLNNWQAQKLAGQLQKYYSPANLTYLGWINCDRFYQFKEQSDVQLDLPITFNKGSIHYFVLFKSFNGLISGKIKTDSLNKNVIDKLPVGVEATLVAFTKMNGQLYHFKEDIVIQKNNLVKVDFKTISAEEMTKMFGKNVRI